MKEAAADFGSGGKGEGFPCTLSAAGRAGGDGWG